MRCEDFPCCGHEAGDCPDPDAHSRGEFPYACVQCGGRIAHGDEARGHESFHASCLSDYDRQCRIEEGTWDEPEEDESEEEEV